MVKAKYFFRVIFGQNRDHSGMLRRYSLLPQADRWIFKLMTSQVVQRRFTRAVLCVSGVIDGITDHPVLHVYHPVSNTLSNPEHDIVLINFSNADTFRFKHTIPAGADPGFFLGGGALFFNTNKPRSFFFFAEYQLY